MSQGHVFVRVASASDESIVAAHRRSSRAEATQYRGTVEDSGDSPETIDLVGGCGSTVFGSLRLARRDDVRWHIDHVYVEPDAREVGIGDALVLHALDVLSERGARWVGSTALPGDRSMKNLFERHGLVAQSITVGRSL